jgi:hypothetical protein
MVRDYVYSIFDDGALTWVTIVDELCDDDSCNNDGDDG